MINFLAQEGFDPEYGARPVRRVIQELIEDEVAEHMLKEIFRPGDTIHIIKKGKDKLEFMPVSKPKKQEPKEKKASASTKSS